jgi:excinuclease UvrABC nuclease subunit
MKEAANNLDFEKAIHIRDSIKRLRFQMQNQKTKKEST